MAILPTVQRATLHKAVADLRAAIVGLDALRPSLGAVLDVLGLDGPRTYLIEQVNPAELRSTGVGC